MTEGVSKHVELKRFRAVVHGRVQGVNFRYYTEEQARRLGLVGCVRNCWDGTVEVVAEGPADALQCFLSWLHVGERPARVTRVDIQWQTPVGEFEDFEVRF